MNTRKKVDLNFLVHDFNKQLMASQKAEFLYLWFKQWMLFWVFLRYSESVSCCHTKHTTIQINMCHINTLWSESAYIPIKVLCSSQPSGGGASWWIYGLNSVISVCFCGCLCDWECVNTMWAHLTVDTTHIHTEAKGWIQTSDLWKQILIGSWVHDVTWYMTRHRQQKRFSLFSCGQTRIPSVWWFSGEIPLWTPHLLISCDW